MKNILIIGDTHEPFTLKYYLDFCLETKKELKCTEVVMIGDIVDLHALSFHEHNPNGLSPSHEIDLAKKHLKKWYKAFKKVKITLGRHDRLPSRKATANGLPKQTIKSFREIWELPTGWEYDHSYQINGVKYFHGDGYSGLYPHAQAARHEMQNVVIGHLHAVAGVHWSANDIKRVFGMAVGCGIDRKKYAFAYGLEIKRKPIIGCGVVFNNGKDAQFIPMKL